MNDAPKPQPMPARADLLPVASGSAQRGRPPAPGGGISRHFLPCARVALFGGSRALILAGLIVALLTLGTLLLFRFVDPPTSALMVTQRLAGVEIDNRWVPLRRVSPNVVRAIILSEDNKFCSHAGLDLGELRAAMNKAEREGVDGLRGASTISQQVAKNLLLWPGRSLLRKGIEIGITLPMEQIWPKTRIMEVYLNIAEWGPGIFGVEAASRYHFNKSANRLTQREAALLAAALPNPFERVAGNPGPGTRRLASTIEGRMSAAPQSRFACILSGNGAPK
jgi:monofunctional glycosyltransferase